MYVDKQEEFSDSQAVTATALSTNVIDLTQGYAGLTTTDIGGEECVWLVVQVDEAATASGAATVTFSLESDSVATIDSSPTVHFTSPAIGKAALTAGAQVVSICLPRGAYERYLGVRYTVATGPLTAGKFSAFLTLDVPANRNYGTAYVVA